MAWARIDDAAMSHPKIVNLSDKSFRLWVWGLCYCQMHLTDGVIALEAVPARLKRAVGDLVRRGLWDAGTTSGEARAHDYLQWNESRSDILKKRDEARQRMASARDRRSRELRSPVSERTSAEVLRGRGVEKERTGERESEGKPTVNLAAPPEDVIGERARRLLERYAVELYPRFRHGAKLRLVHNSVEFTEACELCALWDDTRLDELAEIVLTTDEPFIASTDRGFKIFALKASWADGRLAEIRARRA